MAHYLLLLLGTGIIDECQHNWWMDWWFFELTAATEPQRGGTQGSFSQTEGRKVWFHPSPC